MENLGMCVRIKFSATSPFGSARPTTLHNITEIHYNYPDGRLRRRVAFESDIHGTGVTYDIQEVAEFEAIIETALAEHIY